MSPKALLQDPNLKFKIESPCKRVLSWEMICKECLPLRLLKSLLIYTKLNFRKQVQDLR